MERYEILKKFIEARLLIQKINRPVILALFLFCRKKLFLHPLVITDVPFRQWTKGDLGFFKNKYEQV